MMSNVSDWDTYTSLAREGASPCCTRPFTLTPRDFSISLSVKPKYMGGLSIFFQTLTAP